MSALAVVPCWNILKAKNCRASRPLMHKQKNLPLPSQGFFMSNNIANNYYPSLNGMRGIAVLLVMSFHFRLNDFGWMGVLLFFVLSGFLITERLQFAQTQNWSLGNQLKWFWRNRALRIFPLYFLFLLLLIVCFYFFHAPANFDERAVYLFTFSFNLQRVFGHAFPQNLVYGHLWSLCVEEQFYLFYPLLFFWLAKKRESKFPFVLVVIAIVFRIIYFQLFKNQFDDNDISERLYYNPLSHLDSFMAGALLAIYKDQLATFFNKFKLWQLALTLFVIFGLQMCFNWSTKDFELHNFMHSLGYHLSSTNRMAYAWKYSIIALFFASLIGACILADVHTKNSIWLKALRSKPLQFVGKISYGMYVFHGAVLSFMLHYLQKENGNLHFLLFIPFTIATIVLATLSYYLFENKFLQLKKKIKTD
jgi:peptidoglycan/LPS O-acetylase OafA/YrhL